MMTPTGVSLGSVRFLSPGYSFAASHERGHSWQALVFGPFYWLFVAGPSLLNYFHVFGPGKYYWPEKNADWLGKHLW